MSMFEFRTNFLQNLEPVNGDLGIEEMKPPENWQWKGGWKLDKRVSTDSAGQS